MGQMATSHVADITVVNPRCWYCGAEDDPLGEKVYIRWNPSSPDLPLNQRRYCRSDVRYYGDPIGHFSVNRDWYEDDRMPQRFLVANFRDPRERLVSAFNSAKHSYGLVGSLRDDMIANHSDTAFDYATYTGIAGCQAKMLQGIPCASPLHPEKWSNNLNHPTLPQLIARAEKVIRERFAFVGLTSQYNASVCLFHHMFGGKLERFEMELHSHSGAARYDSGRRMPKKLGRSLFAQKYEWQTIPVDVDKADYAVFKLAEKIFIRRLLKYKLITESDIEPQYLSQLHNEDGNSV